MCCYLSSPNPKLQRRSGSPPVGGDVPRLLHLQRPPLHPPRPPRHLDLLHPQDGLLLCVCQRGTATQLHTLLLMALTKCSLIFILQCVAVSL